MICRRIRIPAQTDWLALVNGALTTLVQDWNWEQFGTSTIDETIQTFYQILADYTDSTGYCMIGSIFPYMTADPPTGTLICDGVAHLRIDYPDLYAALDAAFIIDADSFITPDLRDRTVIGAGDAGGTSTPRTVGEIGGEESHILIVDELAAHDHTSPPHGHTDTGHQHTIPQLLDTPFVAPGEDIFGASIVPIVSALTGFASANITNTAATIDSTGDDQPHNNMQPFLALNYCVVAL